MENFFAPDEERKAPCQCEHCQNAIPEKRDGEFRKIGPVPKPANSDSLSTEIKSFEEKNAVEITRNGNKLDYKISYNGKDLLLTSSDASAKGMESAEKKIAELVAEKQTELEKTFNVAFSKAGDDVVKQWVEKADCTWERGDMVKARSPKLFELYGIQACLYRSQPSDISATGNGIKFHFLEDNYYKNQPVLAYFVYEDKDNRQSVYFEPGANKSKPATEADAERLGRDHLASIEALTTHELAHNHEDKTGWHIPAQKEKLSKAIGWLPLVAKDGSTDWLFQGKKGELFRYGRDHCKDSKVWVKCDKDGNPLDKDDKVAASFKEAKQYKRTEIAEAALVKPLTYYFPNPIEMYAEGLMLYRLGNKHREELLRDSPALYKAAKSGDQNEIDQRYGLNTNGEAKYIRGVDGLLKSNDAAAQKSIQEFEDKVSKKAQNKTQDKAPETDKTKSKPASTKTVHQNSFTLGHFTHWNAFAFQ